MIPDVAKWYKLKKNVQQGENDNENVAGFDLNPCIKGKVFKVI